MDVALRDAIGIVAALPLVWLALNVVLVLVRRGAACSREAMRVLPDTIGLLRRMATERTIPAGVRVRLWLLFVYLAIPVDLMPDFIPALGSLVLSVRPRPSSQFHLRVPFVASRIRQT